jgi:8-oxo-dGTP diphosphatase
MVIVVAALIEWNGKLLVCQRRRGGSFELMWEFPGGKQHAAESPEEALKRELREELGVEAEIGREVYRTRHEYPELSEPIELIFLRASVGSAKIQNLAFETMEWRAPDELAGLNFLPADRELVARIASGELVARG